MKYNQQHYKNVFNDPESVALLNDSVTSPSLQALVQVNPHRDKFHAAITIPFC